MNVDTSIPTLELVRIESNNDNTSLAKFGDTVTLDFDASETIETPSVLINGVEATVSGSENSWQSTYQVPDYRVKVSSYAGSGKAGNYNDDNLNAEFNAQP